MPCCFAAPCFAMTALLLSAHSAQAQGVAPEIAAIEKLPRKARVPQLEVFAARPNLSDPDRLSAVIAWAAHAKDLSPQYGMGTYPIDVKRWRTMLEWAYERDAGHRDVTMALLQLLLNEADYKAALPIAQAFVKAAPQDHAAKAWSQWCTEKLASNPGAKPRLTFPVHFCVLTRNPQAAAKATREQCLKETEIFNEQFRTLAKKPLVTFEFKSYSSYADVRDSKCELLALGDSKEPYSSARVVKAFNACNDPKVRDPKAINVYIFDAYSERPGYGDKTSHGTRNSNRPYVLIDWERLGSNIQNAEPHEMGHAFGLDHVGVIGATGKTSTNIMASGAEGFGNGGERDLGFTEAQSALILYHAQRTAGRLGLK